MKYIFCIGLFFGMMISSLAQEVNFKYLSVQDGLSRSWVKCFLEDKTGFLWIGTADGLNKYDGKNFKTYNYIPNLEKSLNHNYINVIFEDSKEKLWVGTQAGLNYYHRELDAFVPVSSINLFVTSLFELKEDILLLGTAGGLHIYNTADHSIKLLFENFYIEKIIRDQRGSIWLATHKGLLLFDPIENSGFLIEAGPETEGGLSDSFLKTIFQDSRGGIWIGTASQGLSYFSYPPYKPEKGSFVNFIPDPAMPGKLTNGAIYAIEEDKDHNLWMGIENGGINLLNLESFYQGNPSFTKVEHNPSDFSSLSNNSIHALYTDRQNTMWVGTYAGGVNYCNKLLQRFGHHEILPDPGRSINDKQVSAIYDEEEYLWIGTEKGLNRYDKKSGQWEYFTHDFNDQKSIGSNAVLAILRDSRDQLWAGAYNGGLNLFNETTKTFTNFRNDPKIPSSISGDNIYQLIESHDHKIWIGYMGSGLSVFNPDDATFRHFHEELTESAISSNWVQDILEDHLGNIWISTTEAIDVLNPVSGHVTTFSHDPANPKSISYNGGTSFFKDSRNTVWIGTSNGLNYFNREDSSFRYYSAEDGLPSNFIKAITEDSKGNIWISTNNTLTKFVNGTSLPQTPEFKNYAVFDDIQNSEFNNHAVFCNQKGELLFGSTNGFFVFNPLSIVENPFVPEIVFTDLRINNKAVGINSKGSPLEKDIGVTSQLKLTQKQNVFSIDYAALSFLEPENNQYAFKLEGFDEQWNYVGHQQSATYTNLDPGKYTFKVRASNNDGLWNEEGSALEIVILPAWWQTWYARTAYVILIILGIAFFRKHTIISVNLKNVLWREHLEKQKLEELARMKQDFFANISHEIRTPLTLILGPLTKLVKEKKTIPELNLIFRNSIRLKMLIDQFLNFSKVESQMMTLSPTETELLELTKYIIADFTDYAGQKDIEMKLESTFSKCITKIDQDKYEKILTNLLSNAVKSISGSGTVMTNLEYDRELGNLIIRIRDTGRGIAPEEAEHIFERYYSRTDHSRNTNGTGIGLYLTRQLIELQKGTISFQSKVGEGSIFTVILPLKVSEFNPGRSEIKLFSHETETENTSNDHEEEEHHFERTILVIDDNEDICNFIEGILCNEFNVVKEHNPLNGIDKIIKHMPDLIISDVMMPEMDGFQLCRLIKEDVRFSHIPVIMLTAKATKNDHIAGYETGADDYIYKPFDEEILRARVKSLIIKIEKLRKHFIGHDGIINPGVQTNALDVKFMEGILESIKHNYSDPDFHVNQIIEEMGMSRSLFYKKFKSLSDHSINDLVKNFRLKKATMLLAEGQLTISQVAYDCGFTDPAYFSRVFKEHFQIAPKEFSVNGKSN